MKPTWPILLLLLLTYVVFGAFSAWLLVTHDYETEYLGLGRLAVRGTIGLYQDELTDDNTLARGNHHWATAKAELQLTDFVSVATTVEHGEQPPKYKKVNRNLTFDLVLKAKRTNGPARD